MDQTEANSVQTWDKLWSAPESRDWREEVLRLVYDRIVQLVPAESAVVDIGGGVGALAKRLNARGHHAVVWDHSPAALEQARAAGICADQVDLLVADATYLRMGDSVVVATEVLEHLPEDARVRLLDAAKATGQPAFFSVPNDRLGPDTESSHTIKWTAREFRDYLRRWWPDARVECIGPFIASEHNAKAQQYSFLLGVCGMPDKGYRLSLTLPIRNEGRYIGKVIESFYGAADEIVIGIDPRTDDDTREVVARYTDLAFDLTELRGPPDDQVPEGGIHFSHARNQCLARCTGDWVFMTEGHERLAKGMDTLLALGRQMPKAARLAFVLRVGQGQQWGFPWLERRLADGTYFQYSRATHNFVNYPPGTFVVQLPTVMTSHERDHASAAARRAQRKVQNRTTLFDDWRVRGAENSLFYLAGEWREYDEERARVRFEQFLALPPKNGSMRYQARLSLARIYRGRGDGAQAREVLLGCAADDWSRSEHYLWLGDLATEAEHYEEALSWYKLNGANVGNPPFTVWWIDVATYRHVGAQRLATAFSALGRYDEALVWARRILELLPDDPPQKAVEECERNIELLEEAIAAGKSVGEIREIEGIVPEEMP